MIMKHKQEVKIFKIKSRKLPTDSYFIQESSSCRLPFNIKRQQISGEFLTVAAAVDEYTAAEIAKLLNQDNGGQDG